MRTLFLALAFAFCISSFSTSASAAGTPCTDTSSVLAWDGVTDDSSALVSAITSAISASGSGAACLLLPVGKGMLCSVAIPDFPNGLTLLGRGVGATEVVGCNSDMFQTTTTTSKFLEIGNFRVTYPSQRGGGRVLDVSYVYNVNVHDIRANLGWDFARFQFNNNVMICRTDLRTFKGTVFTLNGGYDFRMCSENNYDDDNPGTGEVSAYLLVRRAGGIILGAIDAIHCGNCYTFNPQNINPADPDIIEWVFVDQTVADTCSGVGWLLNPDAGATIKGFQAQGLWGSSCAGEGFRVQGAGTVDGISLTAPRFLGNGKDGVNLGSGANISIVNPTISGNSASSSNLYAGLSIGGSVSSFSVVGGYIGQTNGLPNSQHVNILVSGGTGMTFTVMGVNLCGYGSGGTGFYDASGSGSKIVVNNHC